MKSTKNQICHDVHQTVTVSIISSYGENWRIQSKTPVLLVNEVYSQTLELIQVHVGNKLIK